MTFISDGILDATAKTPTLIGARSRETGDIKFPFPLSGSEDEFERVQLKRQGTLWAFTIQRFPPGKPFMGVTDRHAFKPFGIGYVELEGEVIVETRIVTKDFSTLEIGMAMSLVIETFERGDGQGDISTYAFQPSAELSS